VTPQEIERVKEAGLDTPMILGTWVAWFSLLLKRKVTKEEAREVLEEQGWKILGRRR
jgi:hypothetical protein